MAGAAGLAGLAFLPGGYTQQGLHYQQLREAEIQDEGLTALGKALQGLQGAGAPTASTPGTAPMAPPGGPMLPPGGLPGGLPGGAMPPMAPMGGPGLSPPSGAPPAAGPGPAGSFAPSPPGGAAAGGVPGRPAPGGSPGFASTGGPPALGVGMPAGTMSWQDLATRIVQANPGAKPEVIAAAVSRAIPFMNLESQNQWKMIQAELSAARLNETTRYHEGMTAGRAAGLEERKREFEIREARLSDAVESAKKSREAQLALRQEEQTRRNLMSNATLDKQEFDRQYKIWEGQYRAYDRALRDRINASTNLTGDDKKAALKEIDTMFKQSMDDMADFKSRLPDKAAGGARMEAPGGTRSPAANRRVREGFTAAGAGAAPKALTPNEEAQLKQHLQTNPGDKAAAIEELQSGGFQVPPWLLQ